MSIMIPKGSHQTPISTVLKTQINREMLGTPILAQLCTTTHHMVSCDW